MLIWLSIFDNAQNDAINVISIDPIVSIATKITAAITAYINKRIKSVTLITSPMRAATLEAMHTSRLSVSLERGDRIVMLMMI